VDLIIHLRLHMIFTRRHYMLKLLIDKIKKYIIKRKHIQRMKKIRKADPFIYD